MQEFRKVLLMKSLIRKLKGTNKEDCVLLRRYIFLLALFVTPILLMGLSLGLLIDIYLSVK
jgi:hypothetical protein